MYSYGGGAEETNTPMLKLDLTDDLGEVIGYTPTPMSLSIHTGYTATTPTPEVKADNCSATIGVVHKYTLGSGDAALHFTFTRATPQAGYDVLGKVGGKPSVTDNAFWFRLGTDVKVKSETLKVTRTYDGLTLTLFLTGPDMAITTEAEVLYCRQMLGRRR